MAEFLLRNNNNLFRVVGNSQNPRTPWLESDQNLVESCRIFRNSQNSQNLAESPKFRRISQNLTESSKPYQNPFQNVTESSEFREISLLYPFRNLASLESFPKGIRRDFYKYKSVNQKFTRLTGI